MKEKEFENTSHCGHTFRKQWTKWELLIVSEKNTGPFPRLLLTAAPRLNLKVLIETHGFLGLSKHVNADSY